RAESAALFHLRIESLTLDVLHDHVDGAIGSCPQIVNRHCVWMAKSAGSLSFPAKTTKPFGVSSNLWRQDFNGNSISQKDVARLINGPHASFAQKRFHLILTVKHSIHQGSWIAFQNFSIDRA